MLLAALLLLSEAPAPGNERLVHVPRGAPAVVDGRVDEAEWKGSAVQPLPDGAVLRLRHDGQHVFLGITSPRPGFASVCIASGDTVRVYHASAALGSVAYTRGSTEWTTSETEFSYGMRTRTLDDKARAERSAFLAQHGWLASTFHMGGGRAQEIQFPLAAIPPASSVALAFFVLADDAGSVLRWPAGAAAADGCWNEKLVQGEVPPRLHFMPQGWSRLEMDR